jgi:hypothetical protein
MTLENRNDGRRVDARLITPAGFRPWLLTTAGAGASKAVGRILPPQIPHWRLLGALPEERAALEAAGLAEAVNADAPGPA